MRVILLVLLGGAASTAAMELGLRLIEHSPAWRILPVVQTYVFGPHYDLGHSTLPNLDGIWRKENRARVITNSFGLRDDAIAVQKPHNGIRVALVGDSYTEALQVEHAQTFEAVAEKHIAGMMPDRSFEIVNLGQSGASGLQQVLRFGLIGAQFEPDLAVWMIDLGKFTDPTLRDDSSRPGYVRDSSGNLHIGHKYRDVMRSHRFAETTAGRIFFWLMHHSRIFLMVHAKFRGGENDENLDARTVAPPSGEEICQALKEEIDGKIQVWRLREPSEESLVVDRLLADTRTLLRKSSTVGVFAVSGIPTLPTGCEDLAPARALLVSTISGRLNEFGIFFHDIEADVVHRVGGENEYRSLFGFGVSRGRGHLNTLGHEVYAKVLVDLILMHLSS